MIDDPLCHFKVNHDYLYALDIAWKHHIKSKQLIHFEEVSYNILFICVVFFCEKCPSMRKYEVFQVLHLVHMVDLFLCNPYVFPLSPYGKSRGCPGLSALHRGHMASSVSTHLPCINILSAWDRKRDNIKPSQPLQMVQPYNQY